jgi:two-component system sensor histidine kinase/response regulator
MVRIMSPDAPLETPTERRVLIVDDDPALLAALPDTLRLRLPSLAVDVAQSGVAALQTLRHNGYDAIVSDCRMPGMDGLALLTEAKKVSITAPIILITAAGDQQLIARALDAGAYDFLPKPIDRDQFVQVVREAIRLHQLYRQVARHSEEVSRLLNRYKQYEQGRLRQGLDPKRAGRVPEMIKQSNERVQRSVARSTLFLERLKRRLEQNRQELQRAMDRFEAARQGGQERARRRLAAFPASGDGGAP